MIDFDTTTLSTLSPLLSGAVVALVTQGLKKASGLVDRLHPLLKLLLVGLGAQVLTLLGQALGLGPEAATMEGVVTTALNAGVAVLFHQLKVATVGKAPVPPPPAA